MKRRGEIRLSRAAYTGNARKSDNSVVRAIVSGCVSREVEASPNKSIPSVGTRFGDLGSYEFVLSIDLNKMMHTLCQPSNRALASALVFILGAVTAHCGRKL